jgi:subtilisin family serine protease
MECSNIGRQGIVNWSLLFAAVMVGAGLSGPAVGQLVDARVTTRNPVWAAETYGGYASDYVIIQVQPGMEPRQAAPGRWTIDTAHPAMRSPAVAQASEALAASLQQWQATDVRRLGTVEPANVELAQELGLDRYYRVDVPMGTDTPAMAEQLRRFDALLEHAEVDGIGGIGSVTQVFPNDQYFHLLWGLHNTGQSIQGQIGVPDADIDAPEAWALHTGDEWVIVAIIDSGVNEHPDIVAKLVPGWNTNAGNGDTSDGANHGTHVAGTAAASTNNVEGIAGVSWGARVMPVRVLNSFGGGTEAQCADGIIFAADNGAHVGNMSLQYYTGTTYFRNAVAYGHASGMVLVAATGNNQGNVIAFPARWPETIAVGATDNRDQWATFSNYGPQISVSAPGVNVASLYRNNQYAWMSGTSMASPHVAGTAALVWSYNPQLSNDEVRAAIEATADDLGTPGWDQFFGYGRINAHAALVFVGPGDPGGPGPGPGPGEPGEPVLATLTGYTVEQGNAQTSGLHLLESSDDQYLLINSIIAQGRQRTRTAVNASAAGVSAAVSIDVTVETGVNTAGVTTGVELFNHGSGQWVEIASFSQPQSDTVSSFTITEGASAFVNGSGAVRVRIRSEAHRNAGTHTFRIDHVEVVVTPPDA